MESSPYRNVPTSSGKHSQKSEGCYSSNGGTNSIFMLMTLECDVRRALYVSPNLPDTTQGIVEAASKAAVFKIGSNVKYFLAKSTQRLV
jgi:hypothetical protein